MRKRVKLRFSVELNWHVDLPTYTMVRGSLRPMIPNKTHADGVIVGVDPADPALSGLTVEVECPDDYADPTTGKIDRDRVQRKYRGNPKWDRPDWTPPE